MSVRHFLLLAPLVVLLATPIHAANSPPDLVARQVIAQCKQNSGENRFHLHRCLLQQYEILLKRADILVDKLLGMVGGHKSYSRYKKIRWSESIAKSHSLWQKLIPKDCEWEAHILPSLKGASTAIDRCGIKRAAARVQLLEKRVKTLDNVLINDKYKG
ncbi:MAG: hypothetical protein GY927_21760 [bacterium]|nr:hypothetical protein [bacterium]